MKTRIRQILREDTNSGPTHLKIFDLDDTLIHSELPETGRQKWFDKFGYQFPAKTAEEEAIAKKNKVTGWWGRKESLDDEIFENPVNPEIYSEWKKAWSERPNTLVVMLTGRRPKLSNEVETILRNRGIQFDKYLYNYGSDTMSNKIEQMGNLLEEYPSIRVITFSDDRKDHWDTFDKWGQSQVDSGRLDAFNLIRVQGSHH
jgi:hypothetical protein